jgi:two-component system, OmpR family, response regulator
MLGVMAARMEQCKRVLIVDDDEAMHKLLNTILKSDQRAIENAFTGDEALALVSANAYDLVLTDIYMPGMDGLTLLKHIRAAQPQTSVIIMTAQTTPANVLESFSNQAFAYISKPFSRSGISDLVTNALSTPAEADDIRILSATADWVSIELRCKLKLAERLTSFFREFACDLGPEEQERIATAFRELLMNAIEHGGKSDPDQKVNLTYIRTARSLIYFIRDPGDGFSFEALDHAAVSNSEDEPFRHVLVRNEKGIRPGGFGILMTRNFADELLYNAKGNEVMFIKYLPAPVVTGEISG